MAIPAGARQVVLAQGHQQGQSTAHLQAEVIPAELVQDRQHVLAITAVQVHLQAEVIPVV